MREYVKEVRMNDGGLPTTRMKVYFNDYEKINKYYH